MKRASLALLLLLSALPLVAHEERKVILVLVDREANRAYIPEGTVIPPGMNIRVGKAQFDRDTFLALRGDRDGAKGSARELQAEKAMVARVKAKPPLVFDYAPAERFVEARKGYEAQLAKRRPNVQANSSHQRCYDTYVSDTEQGQYGSYYNGFTSTFCAPSGSTPVGYAHTWEFGAWADYSDDDQTISPRVWVEDNNGNYYCHDEIYYSGDTGQCSDSATTVLLQQGCLNVVDTVGIQYIIEWLPGYVENYLGYYFFVDYCTYFY